MSKNKEIPDTIEDIFKNKDEYLLWLKEALTLIRGQTDNDNSSPGFVPEYVEVSFEAINHPRLYFPRDNPQLVIVQLPDMKKSSQEKVSFAENKLSVYSSIKGRIELAIADEFAIRLKILSENLGTS